MKYKIILLFLLASCAANTYGGKNSFSYSSKGFAKIDNTFFSNINNNIFVFHNSLKAGTKINLVNPETGKSMEKFVKRKLAYDNFYKVLISKSIAKELSLDLIFPYVEINEVKMNKTFVAKKAITETIEKNIANKAPVIKININNLNNKKKIKKIKSKKYSILVAEFYRYESAEILKKKLSSILATSNYHLIYIKKRNDKSYELLIGPYNTINKLKNDYITLSDSNFEDLDIIYND
jgi:hypothetical protein